MDVSRRTALGVLGTLGARALDPTPAPAGPHPEIPPPGAPHHHHPRGVRGRMTGARAVVAALGCEGTPCVFGVPGAQN
ncbi:MAG TPA: thiamine pyrophosphate-binding protein, partial [Isosphaeraceae bacterium]